MTAHDPRGGYEERGARHEAIRDEAHARSVRLSNTRAVTFLSAAGALLAFDLLGGAGASVALAAAGLLFLVFIGEVYVHRRVRRQERWHAALAGVASEGLLRLDRAWDRLEAALPPQERRVEAVGHGHPYAHDLDVVGRASLIRILGPVTSERGREIVGSWLLNTAPPHSAQERHGAVKELAARPELREEFTASGRLEAPDEIPGLRQFLDWAEEDPWILSQLWIRAGAFILPPMLIAAIAADVFIGAPPLWILPGLVELAVLRKVSPWARTVFPRAETGLPPLRAMVPQLELLANQRWSDPLLSSLGASLGSGDAAAHRHLQRLSRALDTVESRRNLVYAMFAPLLLLDVFLGVTLDRWRAEHGRSVRSWLEALGEWEALSALATLAHDHPAWSFPKFEEGPVTLLEAEALGHPLLAPDLCVRNDATVGPPGTFLLVTGSNMSGKSTLLRAIGANVVLASAGAPVCATRLSLPPLRVHTSMRIDDSLSEGVSLFMAELLRIREIVEASGDGVPDAGPVLYLLDEILHGTNTAERQVAARGVIRHLLSSGAIGAVSTHDLSLAEAADLRAAAESVHFREEVEEASGEGGRPRLTFDYQLREGIATTRNALKLLETVGLGDLDLDG